MENKSKTSKLAILSGFCGTIAALIFFIIFPYIGYWDDVGKTGPGRPYEYLTGLFVWSILILWLVIFIGVPSGLIVRSRIKRSKGKLKGKKIATISAVVCIIPVFILGFSDNYSDY